MMEVDGQHRYDGRTALQARGTSCRMGPLERADGSAQWEQEQTIVLAAVHGPVVAGGRRESPSEAVVDVHFRPFNGKSGPRERHLESLLHGLLRRSIAVSQHPRTCVQVVLQVCREGGSELAAALNGAVAALVDACVPLHTLLAATCIAATAEGELLVDPSLQEEADASSVLTAAFQLRRSAPGGEGESIQIGSEVLCDATGIMSVETYGKMVALARSQALQGGKLVYRAISERES